MTGTHVARTRMNAAPDPRPDQDAPREDGYTAPSTPPTQPDREALARAIHGRGDSTDLMPDWAYDAADRVRALLAAGTPPDTAPREDRDTLQQFIDAVVFVQPAEALRLLKAAFVPPGPAATRDGEAGDRG